ncbi:MAG TPA: site-2 protease family protein [Dermatophilaceae bacterium]|nr:site-2 protease family protein [Dermatophilaceae bacterium]
MDLALTVLGWLLIAAGIGLSIAVHELGHLIPAKRFGVKCTQYMIGFGNTVASWKRGETEYGIKAVPLGGYVRMIGMIPPRPGDTPGMVRDTSTSRIGTLIDQAREEALVEVEPGDEDRVFYKLSVPRKIAVMFGGPFMNLVLATVLLVIMLCGIGKPAQVATLSAITPCAPTAGPSADRVLAECAPGDPVAPSVAAGLRVGDRIVEVGGTPVQLWSEATPLIRDAAGKPLTLVVERAGQRMTVTAQIATVTRAILTDDGKLKRNPDGSIATEKVGFLGAAPSLDYLVQPISTVPAELGATLAKTGQVLVQVPQKMVGIVETVTGQRERDQESPISVVGVARAGGEIVSADGLDVKGKILFVLGLLFGINLALFLFNLIPLVPLDGGQIAGAVWEGVKRRGARLLGRPDPGYVDVAKGLPLAYAVSSLFIVMTLLLVFADLVKPIKVI